MSFSIHPKLGRAPLNTKEINISAEQGLALQHICLVSVAHAENQVFYGSLSLADSLCSTPCMHHLMLSNPT